MNYQNNEEDVNTFIQKRLALFECGLTQRFQLRQCCHQYKFRFPLLSASVFLNGPIKILYLTHRYLTKYRVTSNRWLKFCIILTIFKNLKLIKVLCKKKLTNSPKTILQKRRFLRQCTTVRKTLLFCVYQFQKLFTQTWTKNFKTYYHFFVN